MDASALASAESWLYWIGIARLIATFLVAIGVAVEFGGEWASRPFEKVVAKAREAEFSRLNTELGNARAAIAKSEQETAKANEIAATARAEQERLKQLVIWRTLTDKQVDDAAAKLSAKKQTVLLQVVANDPEAMYFAGQLSRIFNKAGWEATPSAVSWGDWLPLGLGISGPDNETVRALHSAFEAAGIKFEAAIPPRKPDMSIDFNRGSAPTATLLVGSKVGPL